MVCTPLQLEAECIGQVLTQRIPFLRDPARPTEPAMALEESPVRFAVVCSSFTPHNVLPRFIRDLSSRGTGVLLFTKGGSSSVEDAATLAGAAATYDISSGLADLLDAVKATLANPTPSQESTGSMWGGPVRAKDRVLTPAEQRVVDTLFTPGSTAASTARELGLSVQTVRNHLSNIRRKLSGAPTSNLTSLRFALIDAGLLDQ